MPIAKSVEDTVLGEALAGDFQDMLSIVSVIDNRSKSLGVTYDDVVAAPGQFDAYGKAMPPGVGKYRDMAKQAISEVRSKGPVHTATFYATPAAAKGLPRGLSLETKTAGHQFYSDPQNRSIATAEGYKTPDPTAISTPRGMTNVAGDPADTLYSVTEAAPGFAQETAPSGTAEAPSGLAALSPSFPSVQARTGMSFKSPTVETAFSALAPSMQAAYKGIERGLTNPDAYTVTSTTEPRGRSPSKSHVRDKAAIDVRTRDMSPKALDDLAVAAMYDKGVKSISWDHTAFAPHAHIGTTAPYGLGLQAKSDISRLSPDVQQALRSWSASKRTGEPFAPMVPEAIAPTPLSRAAPAGQVERGTLAAVPGYGQTTYAAPVGAVERGVLGPPSAPAPVGPSYNIDQPGLTAPSFTGPPAQSVSTQAIGRDGVVAAPASRAGYGPAGATPAGFAELGVIGKTGRVGTAAPAPESIVGPIAMPTQMPHFAPTVAPPAMPATVPIPTPRTVAPPRAVAPPPVAPPVAPASRAAAPQQAAPAAPAATAADVWGGRAQTGVATSGSTLTRNPDGTLSRTSKYGYTDTLSPAGEYRGTTAPGIMGAFGRLGQVSIPGPLGQTKGVAPAPQATPGPQSRQRSGVGTAAKGMVGAAAGGMIGGLLGPAGGMLGAMIGRNLATGKTATGQFKDALGLAMPTPTQARSMYARGFTPGLGFPTAPAGNASQGGLTSFGEAAAQGAHGGQAQAAANSPGQGLY